MASIRSQTPTWFWFLAESWRKTGVVFLLSAGCLKKPGTWHGSKWSSANTPLCGISRILFGDCPTWPDVNRTSRRTLLMSRFFVAVLQNKSTNGQQQSVRAQQKISPRHQRWLGTHVPNKQPQPLKIKQVFPPRYGWM